MSKEINITIVGLSGQGIVMAARILASALLSDGNRVIMTDIPAPTHRFAPTFSHIRCGEEVYSPKIAEGDADLMLAFEPGEGLKFGLEFAREGGTILLSDRPVGRVSGPSGQQNRRFRPPSVPISVELLRQAGVESTVLINAYEILEREHLRAFSLNMLMLGAGVATGIMPVADRTVEMFIQDLSPRDSKDSNLRAFRRGIKRYRELILLDK